MLFIATMEGAAGTGSEMMRCCKIRAKGKKTFVFRS
jgi:hypothetical protein